MRTIRIAGKAYEVGGITLVAETVPQLAQLMKARGFDAYGTVRVAVDRNLTVYRSAKTGQWQVVHEVRPASAVLEGRS